MVPTDNFAFLLPVIMLTFGCTFLIVGHWGSRQARIWGTGYLSAAAAFSVPLVLSWLPVQAQTLTADALFIATFYFFGGALLARFRRPSLIAPRIALAIAAFASNLYSVIVAHSLPAELLVNDLACVVLLGLPVVICFGRSQHASDRLLLAVASAVVLDTIVRDTILIVLLPSPTGIEGFTSSSYDFYMQVGASILGLLMALTALAAVALDTIAIYRDAADRDHLSGLLNRRGFDRAAAELRHRGKTGAIIICDIDHFKRVNDKFGHAMGDRVILALAGLLRERLPADALAARFGGEEFVIFLPAASLAQAGDLANAIRLAFAGVERGEIGPNHKITASFGVAAAESGDAAIADQIGRADSALYAAKEAGRNRVMVAGEPPQEATMPRIVGGR
ncbi:diguanylate cyclase [Rhizobium sp. BR 314]|uniref:GGDEF domain-containing protein n=1 Tax=Rhizobium sp. BR 314 TaxID=3040013 RepID=UPI0039BF35F6